MTAVTFHYRNGGFECRRLDRAPVAGEYVLASDDTLWVAAAVVHHRTGADVYCNRVAAAAVATLQAEWETWELPLVEVAP
jgi:hypothetical protein